MTRMVTTRKLETVSQFRAICVAYCRKRIRPTPQIAFAQHGGDSEFTHEPRLGALFRAVRVEFDPLDVSYNRFCQ